MALSSSQHERSNNNVATNSMIQRLGGESMFEFIVLGFVQNLKEDDQLGTFFFNFTTDNLVLHQKEFLTTVFSEEQQQDHLNLDGYVQLRFFTLVQQGFDATHFDLLVDHFINALGVCWVDDSATREAVSMLKSLRPLFAFEHKAHTRGEDSTNNKQNKLLARSGQMARAERNSLVSRTMSQLERRRRC